MTTRDLSSIAVDLSGTVATPTSLTTEPVGCGPTLCDDRGISRIITKVSHGTDKADKQTLKIIRDYGFVSIVVGGHTVCVTSHLLIY